MWGTCQYTFQRNWSSNIHWPSLQVLSFVTLGGEWNGRGTQALLGITYDDKLVVRGIEVRSHDSPSFVKQFQTQLLYILFDCKDSESGKQGIRGCSSTCHPGNRQNHDRRRYSAARPCNIQVTQGGYRQV